jgi:tetratricopeptide (TPR) repeat protein
LSDPTKTPVPEVPEPQRVPIRKESDAETEASLLETVERAEAMLAWTVDELAFFYQDTGQQPKAFASLELLASLHSREVRAKALLSLGQLSEQLDEYARAAEYYERGLAEESAKDEVGYFLNNNLGYSLNKQGFHERAATHCRTAIAVDPERHNAHKNLGIALEAQQHYPEAANAYRKAAERCTRDSRARMHLEQLAKAHPDLHTTLPDLPKTLEALRKAEEALRAGDH